MISSETLQRHYVTEGKSMHDISIALGCSVHKVEYWMKRHNIKRRSRSQATYIKANPDGDPFKKVITNTPELAYLNGVGHGLYWGEGTKANKHSVRLGNTDAHLLNVFIEFLEKIYCVKRDKLKVSIQLFNDIPAKEAEEYWSKALDIPLTQFTKSYTSKSVQKGNYRKKSQYGVATVYFHNKKLRDILVDAIPANGVKYMP